MILTLNNTRPDPAAMPAGSAGAISTALYHAQQSNLPWLLNLTVADATATTATGVVPGGSGSPGNVLASEPGVLRGSGAGDYLNLSGRNTIGYTISSTDGWTGSIQFQASIDGETWVDVGSAVTAVSTALEVINNWYAPYLDLVVSTTSGSANLALWAVRS